MHTRIAGKHNFGLKCPQDATKAPSKAKDPQKYQIRKFVIRQQIGRQLWQVQPSGFTSEDHNPKLLHCNDRNLDYGREEWNLVYYVTDGVKKIASVYKKLGFSSKFC